jgi:hypothetical protein
VPAASVAVAVATAVAVAPSPAAARLSIGPLRVATKSAPLVLPVNAVRRADLTLKVNGHRVDDPFTFAGHHLHLAHLSASDGLRPGRNRLRVRGASSTVSRRVDLPGFALLADAGPDGGTTIASVSRIGAPKAGPTAAKHLRRKWRIVDRPPGADVTLRHRHRARPLLEARTPGTYVLRLKAHRKGGRRISYDTVVTPVSFDDPPLGAPFNSLDPNTGAITIGDDSYGASSAASNIAYVVLERITRNPVESGSVAGSSAGLATLNDLAKKYGDADNALNYLMIVSGRKGVPADQRAAFSTLAQNLGASLLSPENFAALSDGQQFSIVGIPGADGGAATVRIPGGYIPPDSGAITGYLQKNQAVDIHGTPVYDYVSPDRPQYDTRADGSATSNVMKVGGKTYSARMEFLATGGLHVLVLDSLTLRVLKNSVITTNGEDDANDDSRAFQADAARQLKSDLDLPGGPLVLIQTVGKVQAAGPEWAGVVKQLGRVGANAQLLNALDGTTEYALVGRVGSDQPPAEASTAFDHGAFPDPHYPPARLVGILNRTRTATFEPATTNVPTAKDPQGGINLDLISIAYQPPTPFPALGPGFPADQVKAAQEYICKQISYCDVANSCPDVRSCFWQKLGDNWSKKSSDLVGMRYPGDGHGFTSDAFEAVRKQLADEASIVADLQFYLNRLQDPLTTSEARSALDLKNIGKTIYDSVQRPSAASGGWGLGLASSIAGIFGLVAGPLGEAGAGLSAALTFGGYVGDDEGQPILGDDITAKADLLGKELSDRVDLAREEIAALGLLIVSDYGKLSAAKTHLNHDWSLPAKGQDPETAEKLRNASKEWFYEALVPTAYPYLIRGNAVDARQMNCKINSPTHTEAWPNQPEGAQMQATSGYDATGNPIRSIFFFTRGIQGGSSPPQSLADDIFTPWPKGLGRIEKLSFFTPRVFNDRITHATKGTPWCDVGWLPKWP